MLFDWNQANYYKKNLCYFAVQENITTFAPDLENIMSYLIKVLNNFINGKFKERSSY